MEILFFMFVQLLQLRVSLTSPNSIGLLVFLLFISYPQKILWAALETTQRMLYNVQYCIGRGERGGFFFLEEVNTCLREEIYDPLGAKHKETV